MTDRVVNVLQLLATLQPFIHPFHRSRGGLIYGFVLNR